MSAGRQEEGGVGAVGAGAGAGVATGAVVLEPSSAQAPILAGRVVGVAIGAASAADACG